MAFRSQLTLASMTDIVIVGLLLSLLFVVCWLYCQALPTPIPGIPHHRKSTRSILGDIPSSLAWIYHKNAILPWLVEQNRLLDSPIVQVFMRPLDRPWVVVSDFREAEDILIRRTREFDRSAFFGDLFINVLRGNQVHMPTGDDWRAHRKLMNDTMSNAFLQNVVGPHLFATTLETIELWRNKSRLAQGRPFAASDDVFQGVLEGVWRAMFGSNPGALDAQIQFLSTLDKISLPADVDVAVEIPQTAIPENFTALLDLSESLQWALKSPFPKLIHWIVLHTSPSLIKAKRLKDELIVGQIKAARRSLTEDGQTCKPRRALDLIVQREDEIMSKDGHAAKWDPNVTQDEVLGFLIAGHETTSTVISWGLKYLSDDQRVQQKLREALQVCLTRACTEKNHPTAEEIAKVDIPYLDATMEEMLRCAGTISAHMRRTKLDSEVLGHTIPKGTDVFLVCNGPGFIEKPFPIGEDIRSQSSRHAKERSDKWHPADPAKFYPERWLRTDESGKQYFDPRSAPTLPFGGGLRGCFGRKLGMLEIRILLTLIVWNFELKQVPQPYASMECFEKLTRLPKLCLIRIEEAS